MKSISLKLKDHILDDTETILERIKKSRNKYINDAVEFYNRYQKRKLIEEQLEKESKLVSQDTLNILAEFEKISDEIE